MIFLHYDMDAFFASVEQRDNPHLKNKAIAVGSSMVLSCSYEARKYKVRATMSVKDASMLCPNLIYVKPRSEYYFKVGHEIQEYISSIYPESSFVSCDEGFINISDILKNICEKKSAFSKKEILKEAYFFAIKFKNMIYRKYKLSLSVGIGLNKTMAKMATEVKKPNGIFVFIDEKDFIKHFYEKNVSIFPGIGGKTLLLLNESNIYTTKDIINLSFDKLSDILGYNRAIHVYNMVRGKGSYIFESKRLNSSISKETTYYTNIENNKALVEIKKISYKLFEELEQEKKYPKTITLKIRNNNFNTITRSKTFNSPIIDENSLYLAAKEIFEKTESFELIRLIGISASNFSNIKFKYVPLF